MTNYSGATRIPQQAVKCINMSFNPSDKPKLVVYGITLIVAVFFSYWVLNFSLRSYLWLAHEVSYQMYDSVDYAAHDFDDQHWPKADIQNIPLADQTFWLRTSIDIPDQNIKNPPYALFLSGLYSAEVYLNGQHLFSNGLIDQDESAGLIDSAIYIPEDMLVSDTPQLAMRISTRSLGYDADSPFHVIGISEFESDARRELRYYALPLILSSGFLLLAIQLFRIARSGGTPQLYYLALSVLFILFQLMAEVSRSLISYPYDLHIYRSLLIWGFNGLSMLSLLLWMTRRTSLPQVCIYLVLFIMLISSFFVTGFDNKTTTNIQLTAAYLILAAWYAGLKSKDLLITATAWLGLVWMIISQISTVFLLDAGLYSSYVVFLSFIWWWISSGQQNSDSQKHNNHEVDHLTIKGVGSLSKILIEDILYIKAEGNFAEITTVDDHTHLHHLRLGQIMEKQPHGLLRIHRSYAVNMAHVEALKSKEGSRYYAQIKSHSIPISRYKIADFKQIFIAENS